MVFFGLTLMGLVYGSIWWTENFGEYYWVQYAFAMGAAIIYAFTVPSVINKLTGDTPR